MDSGPLVSVIIPFYKNSGWLETALESVYSQTYQNFEIILVNDGSDEDIDELIGRFDDRISYFKQDNKGPASARNRGIDLSRGKYIAFLDSDDVWEPEKLKMQVAYMEESGLAWSHTGYSNFKDGTGVNKSINVSRLNGNIYPLCLYSCKIATPCVMIKKAVLEDMKLRYEEDLRYGEDTLLWYKLSLRYPVGLVMKELVRIRKTSKNASLDTMIQLMSRAELWYKFKAFPEERTVEISVLGKLSYRWCAFICRTFKMCKSRHNAISKMFAAILYMPAYVGFKLAFNLCR